MLLSFVPKPEISAKENLQWLFILRNLMIGGESLFLSSLLISSAIFWS